MNFTAFSIAAHSTWNHFPSLKMLLDCGDGCATHLEIGHVSSLRTVLLTHAHMDHVGGLAMLIHLRSRFKDLPRLQVIHANPCLRLKLLDLLGNNPAGPSLVEFFEVTPDHQGRVRLDKGESVWAEPFPVLHDIGNERNAIGWKIFQRRTRLNSKYVGLSGPEIGQLVRDGATDVNVPFDVHLLTYTGDTRPLDPTVLGNPRLLMHEATYPREGMDQAGHDHSCLDNALAAAAATGSALAINHLSLRYRDEWPEFPADVQVVRPFNQLTTITIPT